MSGVPLVGSGSVAASAGGFAGIGASGAGAGATNRVAANVRAYLDGTDPGSDGLGTLGIVANTIAVAARDTSTIDATVGTASVGAGVGLVGLAISVGVSLATNEVNNHVTAYIANASAHGQSVKTRGGDITISATEEATIQATGVAASASIGGGLVGVSFAGAGVDVTNVIRNKTNAYVTNSVIGTNANKVGNVSILATDTSSIDATVGSLVGALGVGAVSGAVAVGVATASNLIGYTSDGTSDAAEVQAYVEDSSIEAGGTLGLTADSIQSIEATVLAGSVALAGGLVAIGGAGAGASTHNRIRTLIRALIDGDRPASAAISGIHAASIALTAEDTSNITATVNAVSFAKVTGLGGADSVSASTAANTISNAVAADASRADLTATGNFSISAAESATVTSRSFAPSVASGLFSLAEAAALATNTVANTTQATVENSTVTGGNMTVSASDTSTIQSLSAGTASGLSGMGGGAAYNVIANTAKARVLGSVVVAAAGSVSVEALGAGTIAAEVTGDAGGIAAGVAGMIAIQTVSNTIQALIDNSTVSAGDTVLVLGRWNGNITANGGTDATGAVGSGGTIVTNTLANNVSAAINMSTVSAHGAGAGVTISRWSRAANGADWQDDRLAETAETFHGVAVVADSRETIVSSFATGAIGAAGVAVNKAVNLIEDLTEARLGDSTVTEGVTDAAGVAVRARQSTQVTNRGGTKSGNGIGVVGGFDTTLIRNTTRAVVDNPTAIHSVQAGTAGVEVSAWSQELVSSATGSASLSFIGGAAGAISAVDIRGETTATIRETDVVSGGKVQVLATEIADVTTQAGALSAGLIAGVGGAIDFVTIDRDTRAKMVGVHSAALGSTEVSAYSQASIDGNAGTGGGGGIVAVVGSGVVHLIEGSTEAAITAGSRASEVNQDPVFAGTDVTVQATDYAMIAGNSGGYSGSLIAGVAGSMNAAVIRRDVSAAIGDGSLVHAGGDVAVGARAEHFVQTSTTGFGAAGIVGVAGSLSAIGLGGGIDVRASDYVTDKAQDTINDLLVLSGGIPGLLSDDVSANVEAALADCDLTIDAAISSSVMPTAVTAEIGSAQIEAGGDISVKAERRLGALADVGSTAIGLLVGVGGSAGFIDVVGDTTAEVGDNATLTAGGRVAVEALSDGYDTPVTDVFLIGVTTGDGGFVGIGSAVASFTFNQTTELTVGSNSTIDAGDDAALSATTRLGQTEVLADGTVGGFYAQGKISAEANGAATTHTSIGDPTAVRAGGDLTVLAATDITSLRVETDGGSGGFVAVGGQLAEIDFTAVEATVDLAAGAELTAAGAATVGSDTASTLVANADQTAKGVVAKDEVKAIITATELARTSLSDYVEITGASVSVTALVSRAEADAEANCDTGGLGADSDARAEVDLDIDAELTAHLPLLTAPHVEILAAIRGLDTYAYSNAKANALGVDIYSTAFNEVTEDATINLSSGLITTRDLWFTADTISDQSTDALAVYHAGDFSFGQLTLGEETDIQRTTQILTSTTVRDNMTAGGGLVLEIDSTGAAVRDDGIPWHLDTATGSIVVGDLFYNVPQEPPQAHFVVNGPDEISNWISGNPVFSVHGVDQATIINETANPLELGSIVARAGEGSAWNIQVVSPHDYLVPIIDTLAGYPNLLEVQSVGDIGLNGAIDMPHPAGLVDISSNGDISGTGSIRAGQIDLEAGGNIGTTGSPVHLAPGALPLDVVAGVDMAVVVTPTLVSTTDSLTVDSLQAGGNLEVLVSPAIQDYNGVTGPIPTRVVVSGSVTAGGDLWWQILKNEQGGRTDINGPVTAGGDASIDNWTDLLINSVVTAGSTSGSLDLTAGGSIYTGPAADIAAPGTATLTTAGSIYADSAALITAQDLVLRADDSVGQWARPVGVSLSGGLRAFGEKGVYVENLGGLFNIDYLFVPDGNASLTARDTAGNNDLIVLATGATLNAKNDLRLVAGDGISLSGGVLLHSDVSITLVLDAAQTDPDPGSGMALDFAGAPFDSPVIRILTGADDDIIRVENLAESDTVLDIATGAGDDQLRLGDAGQVLSWLSGTILFDGGTDSDHIVVDNSSGGVAGTGILWLDSASTMAYRDAVIPLIRMSGMGDLWYLGVEDIDIFLGLPGIENSIDIDGTGAEVAAVDIVGTSGREIFRVGQGTKCLLSAVHGVVTVDGGTAGEDRLEIVENNFQAGLAFSDDRLTATGFTGQGMDGGIAWDHISTLSLSLLGNTDLTIAAAPLAATTVTMGTGTEDHFVTIGDGHLGEAAGQAAFPADRSLTVTALGSNYTIVFDDRLDPNLYTVVLNASGFSINGFWPQFAGFDKNRILLGSGGGTVFVQGAPADLALATMVGGAGADLIDVSGLPAGTVLDVQGGEGDDRIRIAGTAALQATVGPVFFQGGPGTDTVWISAYDATAAIPALYLDQPGTTPWPYMGSSLAAVRGLGMTNGIFYTAETIDVTLTKQADTAYLKATTEGTETVTIYATDGDDQFYLGGADALTNLHGDLALWGGTGSGDRMWIDNRLCTVDFDLGAGFDMVLGLGPLTGQGLPGTLTHSGFEDLGVFLGQGRDSLAIDFLQGGTSLWVDLGGSDDRLSVGHASGLDSLYMDLLILVGGDGDDEFTISTVGDSSRRSGFIWGRNIQGLTPGDGVIAVSDDFERTSILSGSCGLDFEVIDPALPVTFRGTNGGDQVTVTSLPDDRSVRFYGSSAADRLYVGDGEDASNVYGTVNFYGGDGDDSVYLYELAPSGVLWVEGGPGSDSLDAWQSSTSGSYSGLTAMHIDGQVVFLGDGGTDALTIQETLWHLGGSEVRFDRTAVPGISQSIGLLTGLDMATGIAYAAEGLRLDLGPVSSSQANKVYLDGTSDQTQSVLIVGTADQDEFYVGQAAGPQLTDIHGEITLAGTGLKDRLFVSNADSWDDWDDAVLTAHSFTGLGLSDEITFGGMPIVTIEMGLGSNRIMLEGIPSEGWESYSSDYFTDITNLDGNDVVFMSEHVGYLTNVWKLNGTNSFGVSAPPTVSATQPQLPQQTVAITKYSPKTLMDVWATSGQVDHTYDVGYRANYRWDADQSVDQDVEVYARDSEGLVTATRFHVEITNIPPTVTVPDQTALEGAVSLDFTVTDPGLESGETLRAQWQIVDRANGETIVSDWFWSGPPSFTLAAGTYDITLTVQDSEDTRSGSATLTVTNAPPVVDAGPDAAGPVRSVPLNGSVSDTGTLFGKTVSVHWTVTDAAGAVVGQSDALNWTFQAPAFGTYTAVLTATDQDEAVSSDSATLDLYNITPTVDAGADVQGELRMVPLSGAVSDPGTAFGEIVTWHWVVTDASDAVVAESDLLAWTFQAPGFATYTAVLTATDQYGAAASDAAVLNLFNVAPVADAGLDHTVEPGIPVTLVGAFTDAGLEFGESYLTRWTIRNSAGMPVAIQTESAMTFTTHTAGDYTAVFTVTDEYGGVGTDTCTIAVAPVLPAVNAGADVSIDLYAGPVTLTGSFTDPAAKPNETYTVGWVITNASGTQVAAGTGLSMSYTPAAAGTYTATLSVTDSDGNRGSDARTISVARHFDIEPGPPTTLYLEGGAASTGTITVARFLDLDWGSRPVDHFAAPVIHWGDGTTSTGTLTYTAGWTTFKGRQVYGYYTVQGSHTYTQHSYGQPNQVYPVTTAIVGLPDDRNNYERRALIPTTASINTHAVVMVSMTVNPATPELGQPASITFNFGDGPESSQHLLWVWWKDEANWWSGHRYDIAPGQRSITVPHTFSTDFYSHSYSVWVGGHVQRGSSGGGYSNVSDRDAQISRSVTVLPLQPRVEAGSDVTVEQGQTVTLSGTVSNLSDYTASWQVSDAFSNAVAVSGSGTTFEFTPSAASRYKAVFTAAGGGSTVSDTLLIDVTNVAPTVSAVAFVNDDFSADLAGSFTDPGQAGGELYGALWQVYDESDLLVASAETLDFHFVPPVYGRYRAVLTVTDSESSSGSTTLLLQLAANTAPVADAGTAYQVGEGLTVALDASGSRDEEQSTDSLVYEWDLDGDGIFGETGADAQRGDETGMSPTFSAVSLDGPDLWAIALRVTDEEGETSDDTATVTVLNVAPAAASAGPSSGWIADLANFTFSAADPSAADQAADFQYVVLWGDGQTWTATGPAAGIALGHRYAEPGTYTVMAQATDKDGGTSDWTIHTIPISSPSGISLDAGDFSDAEDSQILVTLVDGRLLVTIDGIIAVKTPLAGLTDGVTIHGGAGNDRLTVDFSGGNPVPPGGLTFHGGEPASGPPGDALVLDRGTWSGSFHTIAHTFLNESDGSVSLDPDGPGGDPASTISYTGLEPVSDNLDAVHRIFTFNVGPETITLQDLNPNAGGNQMQIDSDLGSEMVQFANPSGSLTINAGSGDDIVTVAGVDSAFGASLIINGDDGDDTINLNCDITSAGGNYLDVDLTNEASAGDADSITVGAGANLVLSGVGTATLKASRNIALASGSSVEVVDGNLTVAANQQATATTGSFAGVDVDGGLLQSSGTGTVTVQGKGGDDSGGSQRGVYVYGGGAIVGGTTGTNTIVGTGGTSTGGFNHGCFLGAGSTVSSSGGNITITGTGGGSGGSSSANVGVYVLNEVAISGVGAAAVTITGTGGANDSDAVFTSGSVSAAVGEILIDGVKDGGGLGADVVVNGTVTTTAGGDIEIRSDRDVTGNAAGDISSDGTTAGNIKITADDDGIGSPNDAGTIQLSGYIAAGDGAVTFSLADCDGRIDGNVVSAGNLVKNGGGVLRLNGAGNSYAGTTNLVAGTLLVNGALTANTATVTVHSGATLGGTGTIGTAAGARDVVVESGGFLAPGDADAGGCVSLPGRLTVNGDVDLQAGARFQVQLDGLVAGVNYDQLKVHGFVDLTGLLSGRSGAVLDVLSTFTPLWGSTWQIVDNDATEAIETRFNGLPECAFLPLGGRLASITYSGSDRTPADGQNDVVLTVAGRFDFDGFHQYTAATYTFVSPFQQKLSTNTYGWVTLPPQYFERNWPQAPPYTSDEGKLRYDGQATDNMGTPLTFQVDVVLGQAYEVEILTGDASWNHDQQRFWAYDSSVGAGAYQDVNTWGGGGEDYRTVRFTTGPLAEWPVGSGHGQISVMLQDLGGVDPAAVILALDVRPVQAVGNIRVSRRDGQPPSTPVPADGTTPDTYDGAGAPPGTLLTITASAGMILTADADPARWSTQVLSDGEGKFSFTLQRPTGVTAANLLLEETSGMARAALTQAYTQPTAVYVVRYDFGVYGSPVQQTPDFLEMVPQTIYSATRGYGWTSRVAGVNRKDPLMSALRTDLNYARDATFRVNVTSATEYRVRIYHANPNYYGTVPYIADDFDVWAEGVFQYNVTRVAPRGTEIREFKITPGADGTPGTLDIRFWDRGGQDGNFVVSGIEIWTGSATPPMAPLMLGEWGAGVDRGSAGAAGSPATVKLDAALLASTVTEAAARWSAVGLTPAQTTALSEAQFAVADLGGSYLGLADIPVYRVQIDEDAAGRGWAVIGDRLPITDHRLPVTGVDLLTVVMHELGHLLGYAHTADGLMAPVLGAGWAGGFQTSEPLERAEWGTEASPFRLPPASCISDPSSARDQIFADLSDHDTPRWGASLDGEQLAAAAVRSGEEATRAKVPRRSRLQRYEQEADGWFAELAADEGTADGHSIRGR